MIYKIHKTIIFISFILVVFLSACESCNNQEEKINPHHPEYIPNPIPTISKLDESTKQKTTPTPAAEEEQSETLPQSGNEKNDVGSVEKNHWDEAISTLEIQVKKLENEIEASSEIIDSKIQQLYQSSEISVNLQQKIKQALENKQQDQGYEGTVYKEIISLIKNISTENLSLSKDLQLVLKSLKFDLKSIKALMEQKEKIEVELNIKVAARSIDIELQKLIQSPKISVKIRERIKQELENKHDKKQNGETSMIDIYADIVGLVTEIESQKSNLAEDCYPILKKIKKDLSIIKLLEKNEQRIKDLARETEEAKNKGL